MSAPSRSEPRTDARNRTGASEYGSRAAANRLGDEELALACRTDAGGHRTVTLSVPSMHCGACLHTVERVLRGVNGVSGARANLTARRVAVRWPASHPGTPPIVEALSRAGYDAHLPADEPRDAGREVGRLLKALAVAGFGAGNVMLLSVSVWSGADPETRELFHWISAAIALPVLAYSGMPFFRPAIAALRRGRTNMDVPISVGVLLAFGLSLYDTALGAEHAYFDAAVTLVFFLLAGRTLEAVMRNRVRSAAEGLRKLQPRGATVVGTDGTEAFRPVAELAPGMRIRIAAGERIPADGRVLSGRSSVDASLVTGESAPRPVGPGGALLGGTRILDAPILVQVSRRAEDSFLAEIARQVEAAETGRASFRHAADRVSRLYAPVVHLAALLSALGWLLVGASVHDAVTVAVAVLIVTCPCALGLAAPMVQAIAARRLYRRGILAQGGEALERLGEVDTVLLDKTGVLTCGNARLSAPDGIEPEALCLAQALASHSRHPFSRAILSEPGRLPPTRATRVRERPGDGIEAWIDGARFRLGRAEWALASDAAPERSDSALSSAVLSRDGTHVATFRFESPLREGARAAVESLERMNLPTEILSGDRPGPVRSVAERTGIGKAAAELRPGDKILRIESLAREGRKPLMVGDGLNDAPALAGAHASMAPGEATDIGRQAANLVFLRQSLTAVPEAIGIARRARRLMRQNFAFAIAYNAAALPFAAAGLVTPLFAAVAMSSSSLVVVANALRLEVGAGPSPTRRRTIRWTASST